MVVRIQADASPGLGTWAEITAPWSAADTDAIRASGVSWANIVGFGMEPIPVMDLAQVDELSVNSFTPSDAAVQVQTSLRRLSLSTRCRNPIDFRAFTRLEHLGFDWRPGADTALGHPTIRSLTVRKYPYADLRPLASMPQLVSLLIASHKLATLDGIENLRNLRTLAIVDATSLSSIDALRVGPTLLTDLQIFGSKRFGSLAALASVPSLEILYLENCGPIDSLRPLVAHPSLRIAWLAGGTYIRDGDVGALLEIPHLEGAGFVNRRHYSDAREAIQAAITARTGRELNRSIFRPVPL